jgi:two-component system, NarL family, invasion response regulator UvrY
MNNIIIADDHPILSRGIQQLLADKFPFAYIKAVRDGDTLLNEVLSSPWDLVICDLHMPDKTGMEVLAQVRRSNPALPVLIMSISPEEQYAIPVLKAGAAGYLNKDNIHEELFKAIAQVQRGKKYTSQSIAEKMTDFLHTDECAVKHESLSGRELNVLRALAKGQTVSRIAAQLSLGVTTVSTYRARILKKMGLRSNAELIRYVVEKGLI